MRGTESDIAETNWTPTRTSTAVALLGAVGGATALAAATGVTGGAAAAFGGAVCLAVALWLTTVERWRVPAALGAALLLVPAGAGIAAGVGYESLVAFASSFPAASTTGVVGQSLRILGVLAVLWGCTVAVFGAAASVRGVATARTASRSLGLAVRVALLPVGLFVALAGHALATNFDLGAVGAVGEAVSTATDWLLSPAGDQIHLLSFGVLAAAATYASYLALRELPVRELAGEASVGDVRVADLAARVRRALGSLVGLAALALPVAFLAEVAVPPEAVRDVLPGAGRDLLVTLTSSPGLRRLLWWVALAGGASAVVAAAVRRTSRTSTRDLLAGYAPFVAGAGVVAGVGAVHRPVLDALVGFVAGRLDAPLAGHFRDLVGRVVEFYGAETVVLGLTAGVLVFAAGAVFALRVLFALGFVADRTAGPALAGGGLFLAAAFAGTLETPLWLVLAALVGALAVWDAGEYATALGSEVGRRGPTRRTELLHALWTLSVGALAAVAAGALAGVLPGGSAGELGGLSVALLGAVAGAVLLVMALR